MLMPGLANSLMFVEVDITKFLQLIENLFKYHQINSSTDKLEHLSSYCQSAITLQIKFLNKYKVQDYEGVVEKLQNQYIEKDKTQQIFIMLWLEVYKNINQNKEVDLSKYITNFYNMSKKLVEEEVLSTFIQRI